MRLRSFLEAKTEGRELKILFDVCPSEGREAWEVLTRKADTAWLFMAWPFASHGNGHCAVKASFHCSLSCSR